MKIYRFPIEINGNHDKFMGRSYTIKEVLLMKQIDRDDFLRRLRKKRDQCIKWAEGYQAAIEITEVMEGAEGTEGMKKAADPELPQPIINDKSDRFVDMSMDKAVFAVLQEHAPRDLHVKLIADLIIHEGYGGGRKTAKGIVNSVASVLSVGKREGKCVNVARGKWKLALANGNGEDR
jgi:hypothetical protein